MLRFTALKQLTLFPNFSFFLSLSLSHNTSTDCIFSDTLVQTGHADGC
jgi:hypothetical protein